MVFHLKAPITLVCKILLDCNKTTQGKVDSKMTAKQMRKVLQAFLTTCKELYKM